MSMDGEDPLLEMSHKYAGAGTGYLGHVATASVRALTCTDVLQPRCTRPAHTPRVSFLYTLADSALCRHFLQYYGTLRCRRLLQARCRCAVRSGLQADTLLMRYALSYCTSQTPRDRIPTGANRKKKDFTKKTRQRGRGGSARSASPFTAESILAWVYPGPLRAGSVFLLPAIWRWTI